MLARLRAFLTSRRLLISLTVLVGIAGVGYLLFASFIFDPFEDSLEDTASIVPRDVEYFFRWQDAGSAFATFPEPAVWGDLKSTDVYKELENGDGLAAWEEATGIGALVSQLGEMTGAVPAGAQSEERLPEGGRLRRTRRAELGRQLRWHLDAARQFQSEGGRCHAEL